MKWKKCSVALKLTVIPNCSVCYTDVLVVGCPCYATLHTVCNFKTDSTISELESHRYSDLISGYFMIENLRRHPSVLSLCKIFIKFHLYVGRVYINGSGQIKAETALDVRSWV